jgi:hypothetical protein
MTTNYRIPPGRFVPGRYTPGKHPDTFSGVYEINQTERTGRYEITHYGALTVVADDPAQVQKICDALNAIDFSE